MGKPETLIGFAIKARQVIFGLDRIDGNKSVRLIICCKTASERTLRQITALKTNNLPVLLSVKPLEDIVYKTNCKVIGISDKQFAAAILENAGVEFEKV